MENTTEVPAQTSEGEGKNTAGAEGSATPAVTEAPRTFSQDAVDKIVQARLAEERTRAQAKYEKELNEKLEAAKTELQVAIDQQVSERVQSKLTEQALEAARQKVIADYGLNEEQVARLQGGTADELLADAEKVFGALLVRKPPVLNPGNSNVANAPRNISDLSGKEVIANWDTLWRQHSPRT